MERLGFGYEKSLRRSLTSCTAPLGVRHGRPVYRAGGTGPIEPGHERPGDDQRPRMTRPPWSAPPSSTSTLRCSGLLASLPPSTSVGTRARETGRQQSAELGAGPADRTVHLPPQWATLRPQRDRLLAFPPGALRHLRDGRRLHLHLAYAAGEDGRGVRGRHLPRVDRGGPVPQEGRGERPHSGARQDETGGALVWGCSTRLASGTRRSTTTRMSRRTRRSCTTRR